MNPIDNNFRSYKDNPNGDQFLCSTASLVPDRVTQSKHKHLNCTLAVKLRDNTKTQTGLTQRISDYYNKQITSKPTLEIDLKKIILNAFQETDLQTRIDESMASAFEYINETKMPREHKRHWVKNLGIKVSSYALYKLIKSAPTGIREAANGLSFLEKINLVGSIAEIVDANLPKFDSQPVRSTAPLPSVQLTPITSQEFHRSELRTKKSAIFANQNSGFNSQEITKQILSEINKHERQLSKGSNRLKGMCNKRNLRKQDEQGWSHVEGMTTTEFRKYPKIFGLRNKKSVSISASLHGAITQFITQLEQHLRDTYPDQYNASRQIMAGSPTITKGGIFNSYMIRRNKPTGAHYDDNLSTLTGVYCLENGTNTRLACKLDEQHGESVRIKPGNVMLANFSDLLHWNVESDNSELDHNKNGDRTVIVLFSHPAGIIGSRFPAVYDSDTDSVTNDPKDYITPTSDFPSDSDIKKAFYSGAPSLKPKEQKIKKNVKREDEKGAEAKEQIRPGPSKKIKRAARTSTLKPQRQIVDKPMEKPMSSKPLQEDSIGNIESFAELSIDPEIEILLKWDLDMLSDEEAFSLLETAVRNQSLIETSTS